MANVDHALFRPVAEQPIAASDKALDAFVAFVRNAVVIVVIDGACGNFVSVVNAIAVAIGRPNGFADTDVV
jgi:hypothetical protein